MAAQILAFPQRPQLGVETLDSLLHRGFITPQQHWCGIHLRWLHLIKNRPTESCDWRAAREREYGEAIRLLDIAEWRCVITLCLQDWFLPSKLPQIKSGLDALQAMWRPATKEGA